MCVWAMTSASLWAAPLPPLWVEEEEVVDVVEPWMAWLIQCSMLMLPWLEVGVPWESPCTEPSSSEPEEVSGGVYASIEVCTTRDLRFEGIGTAIFLSLCLARAA